MTARKTDIIANGVSTTISHNINYLRGNFLQVELQHPRVFLGIL